MYGVYIVFFISCKFLLYNGAISIYVIKKHLCAATSNDDSPVYTVHYVVRVSILLPLSGPLSQRAIAVLICV
jgi:hypothetical protein